MPEPGMPEPITDGALDDPFLPELTAQFQRVLNLAGTELAEPFVKGVCALALALARSRVASEIATAIDEFAAQAPQGGGEGFTHTSGMVSGLLGASTIARRHGVHPPAVSSDGRALNAAYLRGERCERERIAYQIATVLPPGSDLELALAIVRDPVAGARAVGDRLRTRGARRGMHPDELSVRDILGYFERHVGAALRRAGMTIHEVDTAASLYAGGVTGDPAARAAIASNLSSNPRRGRDTPADEAPLDAVAGGEHLQPAVREILARRDTDRTAEANNGR